MLPLVSSIFFFVVVSRREILIDLRLYDIGRGSCIRVKSSQIGLFKEIDLILGEYVSFVSVDRRQILVSLHMDASLFFLIVSMYDCCLNKY